MTSSQEMTNSPRELPDFLIIGAMRAGTTSLYSALTMHPYVHAASVKEVNFFDINYEKGEEWYRQHFPLSTARKSSALDARPFITGEASPYYLFHPLAASRAAKMVPRAKLIAMLRNPIDRAYSHYHHAVHLGLESMSFEGAIASEPGRLASSKPEDGIYDQNHRRYAYVRRGIYVDQLQVWRQFYPKEAFLIVQSEAFFKDPAFTYHRILTFLGLPTWQPETFPKQNAHPYAPMSPATRALLRQTFEPHNIRLNTYLNDSWSVIRQGSW